MQRIRCRYPNLSLLGLRSGFDPSGLDRPGRSSGGPGLNTPRPTVRRDRPRALCAYAERANACTDATEKAENLAHSLDVTQGQVCGTLSVIALLYTRANDFGSADPPLPPGYTAFFQVLRHTYYSFCVSSFCIICWATLHSAAEASRCNRFCREFSGTCFKNCFARQVGPLLPLLDGPREHVESVWAERGGGGGAKREGRGGTSQTPHRCWVAMRTLEQTHCPMLLKVNHTSL